MKRVSWVLMLCVFAVSIALAQEPPPPPKPEVNVPEAKAPEVKAPEAAVAESLPTVDQIIDKYIEALGGKVALEKITSRQAKGNFDIPAMGATGTLTMLAKAPNKVGVTIDVPGFGVIQQAFDGTIAWENNPMAGMRELAGNELAARKRDAVFQRDLKLKELYKKIEVKGKQKVGDKDTYMLEATPAEGSAEKFYFDAASGLLVRQDAERQGPEGAAIVETGFEDYKEVDSIKVPFTIKQVMPAMTIIIKLDEVKHNVEIEDSKFVKPSA